MDLSDSIATTSNYVNIRIQSGHLSTEIEQASVILL